MAEKFLTVQVPHRTDALGLAEILNQQDMPDGAEYVTSIHKTDHDIMIWQFMEMDDREFGEVGLDSDVLRQIQEVN